jgi:hypothetical protein
MKMPSSRSIPSLQKKLFGFYKPGEEGPTPATKKSPESPTEGFPRRMRRDDAIAISSQVLPGLKASDIFSKIAFISSRDGNVLTSYPGRWLCHLPEFS